MAGAAQARTTPAPPRRCADPHAHLEIAFLDNAAAALERSMRLSPGQQLSSRAEALDRLPASIPVPDWVKEYSVRGGGCVRGGARAPVCAAQGEEGARRAAAPPRPRCPTRTAK